MKIPIIIHHTSVYEKELIELWDKNANQISLEYGIFVESKTSFEGSLLTRIYFQIGEHEFDSLNDVTKALQNKAFL